MKGWSIKELEVSDLKIVRALLDSYQFKPYHYLGQLRNEQLADFTCDELAGALSLAEDNFTYLLCDRERALGLVMLRLLPWDRQIFGKEMASIPYLIAMPNQDEEVQIKAVLLSRLIDKCRELGIEHLSARVDAADLPSIHALEEAGFRLMDTLIIYSFDFDRDLVKEIKSPFQIRSQEERDVESVVSISSLCFHNYIDRFHSDPTLDDENCDRMYAEWARNSCQGVVADQVFVAEIKGQVVGFATCKFHTEVNRFIDRRIGEIVLVCVSPEVRGHGLYTGFIHHGLYWFQGKVDYVQVVTQINNTYVQHAWAALGFRPVGCRVTFHKWF